MRKLIILFVILILSCNSDKRALIPKQIDLIEESGIDTLKIYNTILNDLIENNIYNKHLGQKAELIFYDLTREKIDSTTYVKKINDLKDQILVSDSLKGILYINDKPQLFERHKIEVKSLTFPEDAKFNLSDLDFSINKNPSFRVSDLKSKFVKLKSKSDIDSYSFNTFKVGELTLSNIYFNKKEDYGILYFGFVCGEKCGEGNIILIKKDSIKWVVKKFYSIWEM